MAPDVFAQQDARTLICRAGQCDTHAMTLPRITLTSVFAVGLACIPQGNAPRAALGCAADAMLVFDGSASMGEVGFDTRTATRIQEARIAMRRAMPQITPYRRVGLLVYGPGGDSACAGIDLRFAPAPDAAGRVISAVEALEPGGLTPIAASVRAAAEALEFRIRPGVVVLVTDGNETCGGRPCTLGQELVAQAADLTVHVIGFRVEYDPFAWDSPEAGVYSGGTSVAKCLADRTDGMYVSTETVDELVAALRKTLGCALIGRPSDAPSPPGPIRLTNNLHRAARS